jgi:hypothetical protein
VIGGRVLDVTAIVGFCTGQSVYAEALVMTAIEENIVLTIPAAALARACALVSRGHELGVDLLLGLPCTVVDPPRHRTGPRGRRTHAAKRRAKSRSRCRARRALCPTAGVAGSNQRPGPAAQPR